MRKILFALVAIVPLLSSCDKAFQPTLNLGVDNTRINIEHGHVKSDFEFIYPIYSNTSWEIVKIAGGDWLTFDRMSGKNTQYVHCSVPEDTVNEVRAIKVEVRTSEKSIPVYFVIASADIAASTIDDASLDNYLK